MALPERDFAWNVNFPIEIHIKYPFFFAHSVIKAQRVPPGSVDESGPSPKGMSAACVLVNPEHPVAQAILSRGMMEGIVFHVPPTTMRELERKHASVLAAFPSALQAHEAHESTMKYLQIEGEDPQLTVPADARIMVIGTGASDGPLKPNACHVRLHDMLPPLPNSQEERMFRSWMEASRSKKTPMLEQRPRYWCDVNDAVPAIIELLKGETEATVYNLAGRRAWTMKATWEEFNALFQRTNAGKTGRFEFEHLEAKGIPSVAVVEVSAAEQESQRPTLTTTHAFLESKTGEGWRPTTPLRRSLMVVIAHLDNAHSS